MWHHAQYRNEELIVLGHDPRRNDCMLVKLSGLPMNEQSELRRIAASRSGQESPRLIPILQRMESPYGSDWFTYLCRKMDQRNSPVFTLPIKEIQESLDADQKAIFKGYGKNRTNTSLETLDHARSFGSDERNIDPDQDLPTLDRSLRDADAVNTKLVGPTTPAASGALDHKMDLMLETLVDESRRTQQLLGKLIGALTGASDEDPAPEPAPKPRRPRPSARKNGKTEVHA